MHLKKILIGIKPHQRMFRVPSLMGIAVDDVLALRGGNDFDEEYYSQVTRNFDQGFVLLKGDGGRNTLRIDQEGVTFSRSCYKKEGLELHADKVLHEFQLIWKKVNDVFKVKDVRRIGMVGEYRIQVEDGAATQKLLPSLITINHPADNAKFHMHVERGEHVRAKHGMPDPTKDDMWNVILDIYDSGLDADFPASDGINVNFDVQRYYSPFLNSGLQPEVQKLKVKLHEARQGIARQLSEKGILP